MPAFLVRSALNTPDRDAFEGDMVPGAPMDDAPVRVAGRDAWLLDQVGNRFVLMVFVDEPVQPGAEWAEQAAALAAAPIPVETVLVSSHDRAVSGVPVLQDRDGLVSQRYDARPGTAYLIRPDQHVAARWRRVELSAVRDALARATAANA